MPITVPQTVANLLNYFRTGNTPTQDQFEELIRTAFNQYQEAIDTATAASDLVNTTLGNYAKEKVKAMAIFKVNMDLSITVLQTWNVSGVAFSGTATNLRVSFTAAFADANYVALVTGGGNAALTSVAGRAAGYVDVQGWRITGTGTLADFASFGVGYFNVAIFDPR